MKRKQLLIIIGIIAAFLLPSLALLIAAFSQPEQKTPTTGSSTQPTVGIFQTQTPQQNNGTANSSLPTGNADVRAVQPQNMTSNAPINAPVSITFSRQISPADVHVASDPDIPFSVETKNGSITITPLSNLKPAFIYTFTVRYDPNLPAYIYAFRTTGVPSGDTFDFPHQRADMNDIRTRPDLYLSRRTPYTANNFTVTSLVSDTTGFFAFTVTLTGANRQQSQQDFIDWVKTQGLTDQQIQNLMITYQ